MRVVRPESYITVCDAGYYLILRERERGREKKKSKGRERIMF